MGRSSMTPTEFDQQVARAKAAARAADGFTDREVEILRRFDQHDAVTELPHTETRATTGPSTTPTTHRGETP